MSFLLKHIEGSRKILVHFVPSCAYTCALPGVLAMWKSCDGPAVDLMIRDLGDKGTVLTIDNDVELIKQKWYDLSAKKRAAYRALAIESDEESQPPPATDEGSQPPPATQQRLFALPEENLSFPYY